MGYSKFLLCLLHANMTDSLHMWHHYNPWGYDVLCTISRSRDLRSRSHIFAMSALWLHAYLAKLSHIRYKYKGRALSRRFVLRVRGPHHLIFHGPQAKFEGSLHWNTLPILQFWGVHWALRQNFTRASLDFQGPAVLTSGPPRAMKGQIHVGFLSLNVSLWQVRGAAIKSLNVLVHILYYIDLTLQCEAPFIQGPLTPFMWALHFWRMFSSSSWC